MRIGIDAKWYVEGPPSGKRVIRSLVDHILRLDTHHEYYIFLNRKHKSALVPFEEVENVRLVYVWAGNNLLSNVFVLPYYANRFRLDALLYQNFISPFGRGKKIAYIHDVLFLSNPDYYTLFERLYFSPLKFLAKRADWIITVSEEEKKRILHFKVSDRADKVSVVYHGVDRNFQPLDMYDPEVVGNVKRRFELPERFLLYVGRLNLRKNVDHLLKAIPLLMNKEIPLVIVGASDWKTSNHVEIIRNLGIEHRVLFKGAVFKDLGVIYSLATVFCFPSYAESFGLPPLEAMACGVPVVVSQTTSLPEVCGEAGNYIVPDRPEGIAAMIDNLLSNDQLYREKQQLGLVQAKKFTWERAAQATIRCIETCVKHLNP